MSDVGKCTVLGSDLRHADTFFVVPDFIGNGRGTECEEFVKAVTQHMFDDDTDEDDRYVARFAATRLSGGALRWYATELEEDTRKSWILLRKALFERYPNDDE